ncbi:MAG: DUF4143 domain-containing protein [Candidatus Obscuribacterales bacterium]
MDSYWSRDVQELFRLERRSAFLKLLELLFVQSGSIFEATRFTGPCEINRQTVSNYLAVLEDTHIVHVIRPFNTRKTTEIVAAPKVYAFDTGFVSYFSGWSEVREDDWGKLWEHFVLNELHSLFSSKQVFYWRDKRGHEIDFVLRGRGKTVNADAIECKWRQKKFDTTNLKSFRASYPRGRNFVISSDTDRMMTRTISGLEVMFIGINHIAQLQRKAV